MNAPRSASGANTAGTLSAPTTKTAIFVTCNGDDTKGWVSKATIDGTKIGPYSRTIATKEAVEVDAPVAVTISPLGNLVIGQMGEITVPGDSLLTYYNADSGKKLANYTTGLHDITGLAYSPGDKPQLYALDFAWSDTAQGGLFQIVRSEADDGKPAVRTIKLLSLMKPTAMAFGADGVGIDGDGGSPCSIQVGPTLLTQPARLQLEAGDRTRPGRPG